MILKIVSPKNFAKKLAFFDSNKAKFWKKIDHNIGFWEKRHFFAENCRKSQKIVMITSTPEMFGENEQTFSQVPSIFGYICTNI
jgi:hypothetical protein